MSIQFLGKLIREVEGLMEVILGINWKWLGEEMEKYSKISLQEET